MMNGFLARLAIVMRAGVRDAIRRRLFLVLAILSVIFLTLYALGLHFIWQEASQHGDLDQANRNQVDQRLVFSATFAGLAMFAIHFLGAVAGTFLVIGAVRGDAEAGLLQQLFVRPLGRSSYLVGRFLAGTLVTCAYVAVMTVASFVVTHAITGWWPDEPTLAVLRMMGGGVGLVAVALAGSVLLGAAANGVATFMVFGLALLGGLHDQLGEGIQSPATRHVGQWVLRVLPFEAMYQWALDALTTNTFGVSRLIVNLGPFGGARSHDAGLVLGLLAFCVVLLGLGSLRLRRLDL
jgi:ABC-type transport system involved in multi-copper enzyme maturation permease subunit